MDDTIRSSAAYIAQLEAVEDMLERGYPTRLFPGSWTA